MMRFFSIPWIRYFSVLIIGIGLGAWLFSDTQPRSLLNVADCQSTCFRTNDIAGMIASAGLQKVPALVPFLVKESDTCIAIRHPYSPHPFHFVFFTKRDIRDIGHLAEGDERYVMGCMAMMRSVIKEHRLVSYRMYSNGPGLQDITYLHFHLVSD